MLHWITFVLSCDSKLWWEPALAERGVGEMCRGRDKAINDLYKMITGATVEAENWAVREVQWRQNSVSVREVVYGQGNSGFGVLVGQKCQRRVAGSMQGPDEIQQGVRNAPCSPACWGLKIAAMPLPHICSPSHGKVSLCQDLQKLQPCFWHGYS